MSAHNQKHQYDIDSHSNTRIGHTIHSPTNLTEQLILVRNPPRERLAGAAQDFELPSSLLARVTAKEPHQELHIQSEDDDRALPLPFYQEHIQKPSLASYTGTFNIGKSVSKQKQKGLNSLRLLDTQVHRRSHPTADSLSAIASTSTSPSTVDATAAIPISTTPSPSSMPSSTTQIPTQLQLPIRRRPSNKLKKRSSSFSITMLGGIQIGLPGFRHSQDHSKEVVFGSMDSGPASPTTPTQAMTRIGSTNSIATAISTPSLSTSSPPSSPSITPTTTLPNTTFPSLPSPTSPTSPTTVKARARALTIVASSPRSPHPQHPPFVSAHVSHEHQVKPKQRPMLTIPFPASLHHSNTNASVNTRQRQDSISNSNLNANWNLVTSPRNSPPFDFLLDDDPFANLTGGPVGFGGGGNVCRRSSSVSGKVDVRSPRSPLCNDDREHDLDEGRGVGLVAGLMIASGSSNTLIPTPLSPPTTGPSIVASSARGPISTIADTSRSTPTSPSRSTYSGVGALEMRSSFPSIASSSFSCSSHNSGTSSSGSDNSSIASGSSIPPSRPQPLKSPPPPPPATIPRTVSQPALVVSPPPSPSYQPHHFSPSSPSSPSHHHTSPSSQHHVPFFLHPHRPSPAHQRPAFKPRPSLPSLNTLAKMDFVPGAGFGVRKVRKGKVGAGLPFEPWNNLDSSVDVDVDLGHSSSSSETSPVSVGAEGASVGSGSMGGGVVPSSPLLPTSASVTRSISASTCVTESASRSTSWHESNRDAYDSKFSPASPTLQHSSSINTPSSPSSSTTSSSQTYAPNVSLAFTTSALTSQPIPKGQKPLLPSQIMALGSEVGVVYGSGDGGDGRGIGNGGNEIMTELRSPPRSPTTSTVLPVSPSLMSSPPPPPPPPQLMSRTSVLESDGMPSLTDVSTVLDVDSASASFGMDVGLDAKVSNLIPKETLEVGLDNYNDPDPVLARHFHVYAERDDDVGAEEQHYDDNAGDGDDGDVDADVDRFMDQFMDHYHRVDREEDQRHDEGGLSLQEQEEAGEEEDDVLVGQVDKRVISEEDENELRKALPPLPQSSISPPEVAAAAAAAATSLIEMAHAISVSSSRTTSGTATSSATLTSAFPDSIAVDTSSAILAPTLRARTRTARMANTATTTTTSVNTDSETDDSSFFDSYLYSYPFSRQDSETELDLERSSSLSGLTPSMSARGSRWSPSESVSGSRSRSLSSTYTSSFESESEESSCPQSSLDDDDDEAHISGGRSNNNIQLQLPQTILPPMLTKLAEDATDTVLHSEVSVLGSPPALSMPFGGNEDIECYVPDPVSIPPVHHCPLSSNTHHKEFSSSDDDTNTKLSTAIITPPYFNDRGDKVNGDRNVNIDDRVGEAVEEGLNPRLPRSQHSDVSKVQGVSTVVVGQSEEKDVDDRMESEVVSQEREEEIMRKQYELAVKVKTELEEDVEVEVGPEFDEWEYVVGGGSFVGGSNGSTGIGGLNATFGHELERGGPGRAAEQRIAMVTPDDFTEPINDVVMPPRSPMSTTSLTTPTTTQFMSTSAALLKDDLTCGSSTAVAAALAMSTWKQDASELVEGVEELSAAKGGNTRGNSHKNSSTHKSGSSHHATDVLPSTLDSSPFHSKGHSERQGGGDENDEDGDEKLRRRRAAFERGGRRDQSSLLTSCSGSSSSSDDDDHYGPASSSPSQLVMNVNLSVSTGSPVSSGSRGSVGRSRFFEDDDEDDDTDDYGDDLQQANNPHHNDDDDDDIPLAKRIPSALTAQRSIRHQVRQEREQRKQKNILRGQVETTRTRLMTLRPAGAVPSSSHDAALLAAAATSPSQATTQHQHLEQQQQLRRQRTQTLTGKGTMSVNAFSPEDLARKLKDITGRDSGVEVASTSSPIGLYQQQQARPHRSKSMSRSSRDLQPTFATEALSLTPIPHAGSAASHTQRTRSMKESPVSYRYHPSPSPSPISPAHGSSSMPTLRPMRSFHRPSTERRPVGMDDPRSVPLPLDVEQRVSRSSTSTTRSRPSTRDDPQQTSTNPAPVSTSHHRSFSQSRSGVDRASPMTIPEPVPPIPTTRISHDEHRKLLKSHHYESSSSRVGTSVDTEKPPRMSSHRPVPALSVPSTSSAVDPLLMPMTPGKPDIVVQQRVFVSDMQRFKMVEIGASTTAGDIIEMIEAEGSLVGFTGTGGWMVFEVAQDFGMERPIRSFELVLDVQASWNKDKTVNYLVVRLTPLAVPLNRSAIPSSSPTHSGYVEWEVKRGKWSKRWMQLREHSVWLSKRDNGRDQVQLCSLSNFDAYQVTRSHRAPKPFAFAVKSTDKLSFFENTADYLHSFACSEKDGKIWMEKILVARSYVLFQERHVLFSPKVVNSNASGVSRSGTRKAAIQRPAGQPLLAMPHPPFNGTSQSLSHHDVFEPGSLLSKPL